MTSLDDERFAFEDDDEITDVMSRERLMCLCEESRTVDMHTTRAIDLCRLLREYVA